MMKKCCLCGVDFYGHELIYSKKCKVYFCVECWEERQKRILRYKERVNRENLEACQEALNKEVKYENEVGNETSI